MAGIPCNPPSFLSCSKLGSFLRLERVWGGKPISLLPNTFWFLCPPASVLLCFSVSDNERRWFLPLQWCWLPLPGLTGMSWNGLTMVWAPVLPPADSSAFLLWLSASPGLPFALHFISSGSSPQTPWRDCLYLCSMGRATACLTVNLLKSAEALHPWPGSTSIQVTPAEKEMVMSSGGSLLGSKVWPAHQGELEKSVRLALLLLSICHF